MRAADERDDIQALVRSGLGSLGAGRYVLLRVADPSAVKAWLGRLEPTRASDVGGGKEIDHAVQVALTAPGLRALGFEDDDLDSFAPEFLDGMAGMAGMAGDERRSHRLGDVGPSDPKHWDWGVGEMEPHILLILLAKKALVAEWAGAMQAEALANGCTLVRSLESCPEREDGAFSREPFGFADGISQPEVDWDGELAVSGAVTRDYRPGIAAGEVLLGHPNEYGFIPEHPQGRLTGRNGSYLVYRQLEQDVIGFWRYLAQSFGTDGALPMAERIVGRRIDGDALPGLCAGPPDNAFLFNRDPEGLACPLGGHIRRANPRSGDDPLGRRGFFKDLIASLGFAGTMAGDAVASARFHRLLRRGRPYGAAIAPKDAMREDQPKVEAGLHFICLNASLARQFEFVQGAWLMSSTFGGLSLEGDPLIGNREPFPDRQRTDLFRYRDDQGLPKIAQGLPTFVTTRGGAYFFLPGIAGLRTIAAH